jgi:8-oxo-dGTP diphosphatase
MRVEIHPADALGSYMFTVIFARYRGDWLYARHRERDTWETAGGHIERGETPLDCAKRELREETGAERFNIIPALDYSVRGPSEVSHGQAFYADIDTLGELPPGFEMAEVRALPALPDKMTYPRILPVLFDGLLRWNAARSKNLTCGS